MTRPTPRSTVPLALMLAVFVGGCLADAARVPGAPQAAADVSTFDVRGVVVEISPKLQRIVIDHEAIPDEMAAMTMPFNVREVSVLDGWKEGDAVGFRYTVGGGASWISDVVRLTDEEAASLRLSVPIDFVEPTDASLYALDVAWTNQHAERAVLTDLSGRPTLVSMIFTHCASSCPMIIHQMKGLAATLPADVQEDVQFVLVSLDPIRDTPEVMRRFAEGHGLDADRWTLLRGEEEDVRMLAAMLGIRYRTQSDGQVAHTSMITVLNAAGEIVHRQKNVRGRSESAEAALNGLFAVSQ